MKSARIRSFSRPYFPAFGLNTERYSVSVRIQYKYGKIRTRKTPNTNTFHAVRGWWSKEKALQIHYSFLENYGSRSPALLFPCVPNFITLFEKLKV